MNHANLHDNHGMRIGTVVVTIALAIILFEVAPEKSAWSIPVKESDEHIIAVQASGGFSLLLTQKQGEEHKALTKEQDYEKQYHYRKRILIVDGLSHTYSYPNGITAMVTAPLLLLRPMLE